MTVCSFALTVLERRADGRWRLNEVKSSTRIKDEHLEEVALQTYVVAGNGCHWPTLILVFINDKYVRDETIDWNELFCRKDVSEDVIDLLPQVPERIANRHGVLCLTEAPDISPAAIAFSPTDCEFWQRCTADKPKDWGLSHPAHLVRRL